ncbi:hypothetical protein [Kutzneria buriramensis]|uniref:PknH-like protein n=1 Tax=Kutzneria buriramensis TaxID=1045776 RepID=A0A3E0H071_9PSEU|nr:hypothetical protein [Kutzneria buriramensis]REH35215.1 hypothetical protein BCF44_11875 [Kutzneria buriramensis]
MRRAYVVAGIGLLVLTASCSGKPNDLRHYATQDTVATTTSTTPPSTTHTAAPTTTTTTVDTAVLVAQITAGLMVDSSVSEIGFHPSVPQATTTLAALPVCSAPLNKPAAAATGAQTGWVGGSSVTTLTEYVGNYPTTTGAQVLAATKAALTCSQATKYALASPPAGVDASYSWCETGTAPSCTVLLAKGHLLARVQVVTTSTGKAQNLITEVAVPAAARLAATD